MPSRLCIFALLLPVLASAGIFGPPKYVQEACKKWCEEAAT
eukprot:CAMPEP_0179160276 /NCGR_PEP_ID=MMETSP0796-20121207/78342_1 /TAXON_ID=73915 /ORGANISM="Pyrodinium bahamense, Strain pbaha01" /LENGTH=40 /DNA_ID= /DNA_START= /DNA_END= /DNA_ORIENTATION=